MATIESASIWNPFTFPYEIQLCIRVPINRQDESLTFLEGIMKGILVRKKTAIAIAGENQVKGTKDIVAKFSPEKIYTDSTQLLLKIREAFKSSGIVFKE